MADNSYTDIMEKNHMEIPWHDYARQDGNILIDKAGLIEKSLCNRTCRTHHALLRHRSLACENLHEPALKGAWCHMYSGCRTYVNRV